MSGLKVQDSKVERLMDFFEAPKQMSDKDLAAKVRLDCEESSRSQNLGLQSIVKPTASERDLEVLGRLRSGQLRIMMLTASRLMP